MIFDTDIFIFVQRGDSRAASLIDAATERYLSIQTYMELLQGAKSNDQLKVTKRYITDMGFLVLPLTENVGHRALIYVEQYTLSAGLFSGDAIIAATAIENNMPLCSSNYKHFKVINELDLHVYKP